MAEEIDWQDVASQVTNKYELFDTQPAVIDNSVAVPNATDNIVSTANESAADDDAGAYPLDADAGSGESGGSESSGADFLIRVFEVTDNAGAAPTYKQIEKKGEVRISVTPAMPHIAFAIKYDHKKFANVQFSLAVSYRNGPFDTIRDTSSEFNARPIRSDLLTSMTGYDFYDFNFGNYIGGGNASIKATVRYNNKAYTYSFDFVIKGTNPTWAQISNYIAQNGYDNPYYFFRAIAQHESGLSGGQFVLPNKAGRFHYQGTYFNLIEGFPLFGPPDGYGVMQIDYHGQNRTDLAYIWNWKSNIDLAYTKLGQKVSEVKNHLDSLLTSAVQKLFQSNPEKFIAADDKTYHSKVFSQVPTNLPRLQAYNPYFPLANTTGKLSFLDASVIRRYNGGDYLFLNKDKNGNYVWSIDDFAEANDTNYVDAVSEFL